MISPQSLAIADVGCDHAYVSIAMIQRGLADKVIAMDVRKGPLEIAKRNVADAGLSEVIDLRLGDGLDRLQPGEVDAIVIAGMGGLLMKGILERGLDILTQGGPTLVLQPQSDIKEVRMFLQSCAYHIVSETMLSEEGKYYTVMKAEPEAKQPEPILNVQAYTDVERLYGRWNLENRSEVLLEYLQKEQQALTKILHKVEESIAKSKQTGEDIPDSTKQRFDSVKTEMEWNAQALSYFEGRQTI